MLLDMETRIINQTTYPDVSRIYMEGIETGIATFETQAPSWESWDQSHLSFGRIVVQREAESLGWAALSPVSSRCVYGGVAEVSIYVKNSDAEAAQRTPPTICNTCTYSRIFAWSAASQE